MGKNPYALARSHMVRDQLKPVGITDERVLAAFSTIPREDFLPQNAWPLAYSDVPVFGEGGHFLLDPATHAKLVMLTQPQKDEVALDLGGEGGYSAAILSHLVATVLAVGQASALAVAKARWEALDLSTIIGYCGPPSLGDAGHAPFDLIVIPGAVREVPFGLIAQLSPKGRLVTILREGDSPIGRGVIVRPVEGGTVSIYAAFDAACPYHPAFLGSLS